MEPYFTKLKTKDIKPALLSEKELESIITIGEDSKCEVNLSTYLMDQIIKYHLYQTLFAGTSHAMPRNGAFQQNGDPAQMDCWDLG